MSFETEEISKATLVKVDGRPNEPQKPSEKGRWKLFTEWFVTYLKKCEELMEAYAEAKIEKEKSQARKTTEEAAEIAARKDTEIARKRLMDQEEILKFNTVIDDIFKDDGLPSVAKALKFAKLLKENPEVVAQLNKVKEVIKKLRLTRGVNIEILTDLEKLLPDGENNKNK